MEKHHANKIKCGSMLTNLSARNEDEELPELQNSRSLCKMHYFNVFPVINTMR